MNQAPTVEGPQRGRRRLLDAAAHLFAHRGYPGTSVREIAAEAGLTTGAIYAHFPSGKQQLFTSIIDELTAEVSRFVADAMAEATDPVDRVVRQAAALWDFFDARPSFAALVMRENVASALGTSSTAAAQNAAAIDALRAMFRAEIDAGTVAPVNVSYVMFWVTTTCASFHGCRPLREAVWAEDELRTARADFLGTVRRTLTPG